MFFNRLLAEAEPLVRRSVMILAMFGRKTGHEHPGMKSVLATYRGMLQARKLPPNEIEQRIKSAEEGVGPLKAIVPEVDQLLGPAKPVADVLAELDRQYKTEDRSPT